MRWITRERPKIDRIACPWLIKRFVDKDAEFIYVPFEQVFKEAEKSKAIPFDVPVAHSAKHILLPHLHTKTEQWQVRFQTQRHQL